LQFCELKLTSRTYLFTPAPSRPHPGPSPPV
jgi:hypothetical protein